MTIGRIFNRILKNLKKVNKDDDVFGDYGEVQVSHKSQISSLPINSLNTEQIESLISTCFPLEPSTLSLDTDNFIPFELPTFTTFKDQTKQLPCFEHSLSLWNLLSKISNDPIGIKYQWRKSNTERLFHQALGVHKKFHIKTIPLTLKTSTTISNVNDENTPLPLPQNVDPHFDWKESGLENPLTVFDVNKTLDLDYYIPPIQPSKSTKEAIISFSTITHRTNSPTLQQQSTPIKTSDLFPGSTTVLNDDAKPPVNLIPNFTFINPKALKFPT